jgi:hypothetical protein
VPLAGQLTHQRFVRPGPLVLGTALLKAPARMEDRDRHDCYRHQHLRRWRARAFLPGSACRHADRTISSPPCPVVFGIWSLRIPSPQGGRPFLLIFRTARIVTDQEASTCGYSDVPAYSRIYRQRGQFRRTTVSRRSKPSSRTALIGEQPNPWDLLQPQDATSRHRTCLHRSRWCRLYLHPL